MQRSRKEGDVNRTIVSVFIVCAALCAPGMARSREYYGFNVGTANAPHAPQIRVVGEPHALLANDAMVYVIDDPAVRFEGDMFRYGQYWFAYTRGFWYRARSSRGPYAVIDVLKVPRAIIGVPRKLWKHHPLGQAPGKAAAASSVAARGSRKAATAGSVAARGSRKAATASSVAARGSGKAASSVAAHSSGRSVTASFAAARAPRVRPMPKVKSVRNQSKQSDSAAISARVTNETRRTQAGSAR